MISSPCPRLYRLSDIKTTAKAIQARIRRKIAAWGMQDLIAPRILAPLNIHSLDEAAAHELEAIEHLLPIATLWRDTPSLAHNPPRRQALDDESDPATID